MDSRITHNWFFFLITLIKYLIKATQWGNSLVLLAVCGVQFINTGKAFLEDQEMNWSQYSQLENKKETGN